MKSIKRLFSWLDEHLLELLSGLLLVFIPLYPKWPLADILPGYIVRLRLEDIIIFLVVIICLIKLLRKDISLKNNPLLFPIAIYLLIGLFSSFSALFISHTVPLERLHVAKLFLHWARRVEYMSFAFIFFSSIKNQKQLKRLISVLLAVVVVLAGYGFGQKYLQWPVYSTMNREFSKGWRLVLTQHARVPSTFAGHYDYAAYLVIALAVITSLWLFTGKKFRSKLTIGMVFLAAYSSLLLTASRTSFIAYLIAISAIIVLMVSRKNIKWAISRWLSIVVFSLLGMLMFGDLSQRFAHVLKLNKMKEYVALKILKLNTEERSSQLKVSDELALVYTETDQPPVPYELPPDVYEQIPETLPEATLSAKTAEEKERIATLVGKPRTYSQTAFTFGLSSAIRFDALWPMAIQGFLKNPLLGSGYSTLVKTQVTDFTEAESTDNDYLRALGETGLLGFISFFAILFFALYKIWQVKDVIIDKYQFAVVAGIGGAIIGLLVNGVYIDVFEASKVAYTFWALMGILFATIELSIKNRKYEEV